MSCLSVKRSVSLENVYSPMAHEENSRHIREAEDVSLSMNASQSEPALDMVSENGLNVHVSPRLGSPRRSATPRPSGSGRASPRPGTPPPMHVSPHREFQPGLPPSPRHQQDSSRPSSRLSSHLTKIASEDSLYELHDGQSFLVPIQFCGTPVIMPPSRSIENLPYLPPGWLPPMIDHGIATPVHGSITSLRCPHDDKIFYAPADSSSQNRLTVAMGSNQNISQSCPHTPTADRARSPCLKQPNQKRPSGRAPARVLMAAEVIIEPKPSTSRRPSPRVFIQNQDPVAALENAAGSLPVKEEIVRFRPDPLELQSPPYTRAANPVPPPSPFTNARPQEAKAPRRSFFSFLTRTFRKPNKRSACKYFHHDEDDENVRLANDEALEHLPIDSICDCVRICPKFIDFMAAYKEYILQTYNAGPYSPTALKKEAAVGRIKMGSESLLTYDMIEENDYCLSVTFSRECARLQEQYLARFAKYDGFKGFFVCGKEAFLVYTDETPANMAMATLNGLMYRLEHTMRVQKTTAAHIRKVYYTSTGRYTYEPCHMEVSFLGCWPRVLNPSSIVRQERRRGALRRRGDERYISHTRRIPPADSTPTLCWPCSSHSVLETDF